MIDRPTDSRSSPSRPTAIVAGLILLAGVLVGACAATSSSNTAALLTPEGQPASPPRQTGAGAYQLTPDEQNLDCKQLTGRMQIRILEIRDFNERTQTSATSRALQSGATAVFGGPQQGKDPGGAYVRDRAMLEAYNNQLLAKGCKAYDLDSELTPQDVRVTPRASIKPTAN